MTHKQLDHYAVMNRKNEVEFKTEIILLLDDLTLPPNIAGIFRLADGLQVNKIYLLSSEELVLSKKFKSISRLNKDVVSFEIVDEKKAITKISELKTHGFHISALEFTDYSEPLPRLKQSPKQLLIAGSEKHGIRPSLLKMINQSVHIPMQGSISSLNVMQAVSIAVYEVRRRELT
jgi:tRNA G18 (ribose-2'-O)-methylase SpoU